MAHKRVTELRHSPLNWIVASKWSSCADSRTSQVSSSPMRVSLNTSGMLLKTSFLGAPFLSFHPAISICASDGAFSCGVGGGCLFAVLGPNIRHTSNGQIKIDSSTSLVERRALACQLLIPLRDVIPIDYLQNGGQVFGATVLVFEVICVFPNVDTEQGAIAGQ